jgi:hypothetical protein
VRGANLLDKVAPPLPSASHGSGTIYIGRGFAKAMNTDEVKLYIVAAALVVTGMVLMVTAFTS